MRFKLNNTRKLKFIFFLLLIISSCSAQRTKTSQPSSFSVDSYGAVGNGKVDDSKAIQNCFNDAAKNGGTVIFSKKTYYTTAGLSLSSLNSRNPLIILGNGCTIVNKSMPKNILTISGQNGGKLILNQLGIDGMASASQREARFNGPDFTTGIQINLFDSVEIKNCKMQNIYGNGIYVYLTRHKDESLLRAKEYVHLHDNQILNCSGLNGGPKRDKSGKALGFDNYGDGIVYSGGNNGLIENNIIINDLNSVGKVGRAGIAAVYYNKDIVIKNNTVEGYDRGIHMEDTYGGHKVLTNTISNCNVGILYSAGNCPFIKNNPINIEENVLTDGIYNPKLHSRIMSLYCFIMLYKDSELASNSIIRNNKMNIKLQRDKYYYYLNSGQQNSYIEKNDFISDYPNVGSILLHKNTKSFSYNRIKNLFSFISRLKVEKSVENKVEGHLNSNLLK